MNPPKFYRYSRQQNGSRFTSGRRNLNGRGSIRAGARAQQDDDEKPPPKLSEMAAGEFMERYDNIKRLGAGSFGWVHLVKDKATGCEAVVKFIQKSRVRRWIYDRPVEIWILENLRGDANIANLIDVYENDEFFQIVMEKHGEKCKDLHDEVVETERGMSEARAAHIFYQVVCIVHRLHTDYQLLHRDLKPANLLVNDLGKVQVIDFGSAFPTHSWRPAFYATPYFRSPQAAVENGTTDSGAYCKGPDTEVWALGVTLYFMVFKKYPFKSRDEVLCQRLDYPEDAAPTDGLKDLLEGMLEKDHRLRLTTRQIMDHPWMNQRQTSKYSSES